MERSVGVAANSYGFSMGSDKSTSMELDSGD